MVIMNSGPMYYLLAEIPLGKVFNVSMPQFSNVQTGMPTYIYHSVRRLNEIIHVKT